MPLATTYRPAEIRKVLRIGDIDTLHHRAHRARPGHAADARGQRSRPRRRVGSAALPPRDAFAARDLDHRGHRSGVGDADRAGRRARRRRRRSTTSCSRRWRPRSCPPISRRSRTRRDRVPTRRASCTRTPPSCAALTGSARHAVPDDGRDEDPVHLPVLLDRRHAHPRCRDPGRAHRAVHRAVRAGRRARHRRGRAGDDGHRLAHAHAVDARPPLVPRSQAPRDCRAHEWAGRRRARRHAGARHPRVIGG